MADKRQERRRDINKILLKLWAGITIYLIGNSIIQTLISRTASFDDAEQLLLTQDWSLGYGDQPPLYTYLAKLIFIVTGPTLLGLFILKAAILSLLAGAFLLIGKELGFRKDQHIASLCGLALIPQFIWSSQASLTHSVLTTTMAAYTLCLLIKLIRNPTKLDWWAWLGVFVAGGMLSKYNFAVFLAGLLTGSLLVPGIRRIMTSRGLLFSVGVSLILLIPHIAWIASNSDIAFSGIRDAKTTNLPALAWPFLGLGIALAFLSPFWIAALTLIWPERLRLQTAEPSREPAKALIQQLPLVMMVTILVVIIVVTKDVVPRSHWFQCLLFFTPISAASFLPPIPKSKVKWLTATALAGAAATTAILPSGILLAGVTGKSRVRNQPVTELISSLRESHQIPDLIAANSIYLAGNARLAFPETIVLHLAEGGEEEQVDTTINRVREGQFQRVLIIATTKEEARAVTDSVHRLHRGLRQLSHNSKTGPFYWAPNKKFTIFYTWLGKAS